MNRFNSNYLNKLKSNVEVNVPNYLSSKPFIENYQDMIDEETKALCATINLETETSNNEKLDFVNSKIIYRSFSDLTLSEVADERMWAFMTHVTHWEYMRERWPIEHTSGDKKNFILNRYFFRERPFSRSGLARLWWFGYITYNEKYEDPFYLTSIMLENEDQDIARIILETPTISRNKKMVEATLISLNELKENYKIKSRDYIRYAARHINLTGSVKLWDYLDDNELRYIIDEMKLRWEQQLTITEKV
ncbi:hypothetical protein CHH91_02460 [Virgibacillus sp. 7505]|uniref:DUF6339 family protein n=1 Tax=Virgibacillus sp. 7505 TaxID=2022548 RepID=UPI000BA53379|nr:DUF6339 family protein [Virgibacillus sp. 7505]PAE17650.1 hypothetical protein CHH91_02460 [Virgibacillus sp. 7505]